MGTLGSLWLYENFQSWLIFLGSAIPPVGGIIIVDYLMNRKRYASFKKGSFRKVNPVAICACFLGMLAGMFLPGVAPINAVLVGGLTHAALTRLLINPGSSVMIENENEA